MDIILSIITKLGIQRCDLWDMTGTPFQDEYRCEYSLEETDPDDWDDSGRRIQISDVNLSMLSFSHGLRHFLSGNIYEGSSRREQQPSDDANLIFNIGVLTWYMASATERKRIATVVSVRDYDGDIVKFCINFAIIVNIITEHQWRLYEERLHIYLSFDMECDGSSDYPVHWTNQPFYTFNINGSYHDGEACCAIFLSPVIEDIEELDVY
jgi:hypothetical protein